MKPKRLARTVIYEHPWVNLYVDRVELPGGRVVEEHHMLGFDSPAVAALVENDRRQILMVQVYRYTTDSIEWEVPAGKVEKGESVFQAAEREVLEEAGYETQDHDLTYTYYPMNGISNKVFHIVRCRAGRKVGDFDRNEVKGVKWVSRAEVEELIGEGVLKDGFSLTALLLYLLRLC